MTLYSDLGVEPDAEPDVVKKAYRRRARETHPDKGGDAAAFQVVSHAYEVLSDPARRSHYDKTGDHGQAAADSERQNMLALLAQYVISAVLNAPSVATIDIRQAVKTHISTGISKLEQDRATAKKQAERLKEAGKRFKRKSNASGDDLVAAVLDGHAQAINNALANCEQQIGFRKRLVELMDTYSYAADQQAMPTAAQYVQYTTTFRP